MTQVRSTPRSSISLAGLEGEAAELVLESLLQNRGAMTNLLSNFSGADYPAEYPGAAGPSGHPTSNTPREFRAAARKLMISFLDAITPSATMTKQFMKAFIVLYALDWQYVNGEARSCSNAELQRGWSLLVEKLEPDGLVVLLKCVCYDIRNFHDEIQIPSSFLSPFIACLQSSRRTSILVPRLDSIIQMASTGTYSWSYYNNVHVRSSKRAGLALFACAPLSSQVRYRRDVEALLYDGGVADEARRILYTWEKNLNVAVKLSLAGGPNHPVLGNADLRRIIDKFA